MHHVRRLILATASAEYCRSELDRLPVIRVIERYDLADRSSERSLVDGLKEAWAVVAGSERYSDRVLQALRGLRAIVRWDGLETQLM